MQNGQPPLPPHIVAFGDQIRALKAQLKANGVKAKDMKNHPQVASMVKQLDQLKEQSGIDPKTNLPFSAPKPTPKQQPKPVEPPSKQLPADLQGQGAQLRQLKDNLKAQGLTAEQIKKHPQVASMTNQLNSAMRSRVAPAPKATPKRSGAPVAQTLSPQAQAYRDQLRQLKNQLRAQGYKGDQLVNHPQVRAMQSQLDQMTRQTRGNQQLLPNQTIPEESLLDSFSSALTNLTGGFSLFNQPQSQPAGYPAGGAGAPRTAPGALPTTMSFTRSAGPSGTAAAAGAAVPRTAPGSLPTTMSFTRTAPPTGSPPSAAAGVAGAMRPQSVPYTASFAAGGVPTSASFAAGGVRAPLPVSTSFAAGGLPQSASFAARPAPMPRR